MERANVERSPTILTNEMTTIDRRYEKRYTWLINDDQSTRSRIFNRVIHISLGDYERSTLS